MTTLVIIALIGVGGPRPHTQFPLSHVRVQLGSHRGVTGPKGRAEFHMRPGRWRMIVRTPGACSPGSITVGHRTQKVNVFCSVK